MSMKVRVIKISEEAYAALREIQQLLYAIRGSKIPLTQVAKEAIIHYWKVLRKKKGRFIRFSEETEQAIKDLREILYLKRGTKPSITDIVNEAVLRWWRESRK